MIKLQGKELKVCGVVAAAAAMLLAAAVASFAAGQAQPPKRSQVVLKGIVLIKDPAQLAPAGLSGVEGVQVEDLAAPDAPALEKELRPALGRPLSKQLVAAIVMRIVQHYRDAHRPLVDAAAPPQNVTSGVVQIVVLEGKVGQVKVEGASQASADRLSSMVRVKTGEPLDSTVVEDDLDWINRNPYRHADLVYARGATPGSTDLSVRMTEGRPYRFFAGYDDTGTSASQPDRYTVGAGKGNLFGGDGQANYQYSTSPNARAVRSHSASVVEPLPWRHVVTLFGNYSDSKAILPEPLTMRGYNWQLSMSYEVPLPSIAGLKHSATAGFDFKRSNNNLAFGGTSVFAADTDVDQFRLGYGAKMKDALGETSGRLTFTLSPGGLSPGNNNAAFATSRAGARAHYHYLNGGLDRTTRLLQGFSLVNAFTGQVSDANLLASEQIGFGGFDTVRGVDTRVLNTDAGYLISTEIRTPFVPLAARLDSVRGWLKDQGQLLFFVDYGAGSNYSLLPGERPESKLLSVGPGVRYKVANNLNFRLDYGWQLKNQAQTDRTSASRVHVGLMMMY